WESEVRYDTPEHEQGQHLPPPEAEPLEQDQQGQPGRRRPAEEEEQVVEHPGGGEMVSPEDETNGCLSRRFCSTAAPDSSAVPPGVMDDSVMKRPLASECGEPEPSPPRWPTPPAPQLRSRRGRHFRVLIVRQSHEQIRHRPEAPI